MYFQFKIKIICDNQASNNNNNNNNKPNLPPHTKKEKGK